ncbi:g2675 [Coccomyxa elongata]
MGGLRSSNSQLDVLDVAPSQLVPQTLKTVKGKRAAARSMVGEPFEHDAPAIQEHENEPAEVVIVCEPEGTSLMMGGLHPRASLYERPVNLDSAKAAHSEFRRVMREHGVKVLTVRDIMKYGVHDHMGARVELEELATKALKYQIAEGFCLEDLSEEDRYYVTKEYMREVLEHMSIAQLIDTILINPTVHISPSYRDTGLHATYTFKPLSNLVYTRDQQITTCKGIVMGRLRSEQRQLEVELMRFCHNKLGLPVVGKIEAPGFLEGGDYFSAGRDLAMVGIGLRSNFEACRQLMEKDLLGTRRLAIVRDEYEQHQDRMHLDCVFSILGDDCCLMLDEMMGEDSATRRLVDEWTRTPDGGYELTRQGVEFSEYMRGEGYHIIPIKAADQLLYGCNVLNLGNSKVLSVHAATARQIVRDPHFKGEVQVVNFTPITSMYGAVHCSSQVVRRIPRRYLEDSDATHHGAATENGSVRGGNAFPGDAMPSSPPVRPTTGGSQSGGSTAAIDILASGRRNGSAHGATSAAEALGISRMSGSLRGSSLAKDALSRQFAE